MTDIETLVLRAVGGQYVADLPAAVSVNITRLRERFLAELPALAAEAAGADDFKARWVEAVNRIIDEAEGSLRLTRDTAAGRA